MSEDRNPKRTSLASLWGALGQVTRRWHDMVILSNRRLAAIENRLAALDGGDETSAALRSAFVDVNMERLTSGKDSLVMKLEPGADGKLAIKWTDTNKWADGTPKK